MTTKLEVCKEATIEGGDGCHRGIERGIKQDADGDDHGAARVTCTKCGVATDWMLDDSLQRAVVGWNKNGLPLAVTELAKIRAAEADAKAKQKAAQDAANAAKAAEGQGAG